MEEDSYLLRKINTQLSKVNPSTGVKEEIEPYFWKLVKKGIPTNKEIYEKAKKLCGECREECTMYNSRDCDVYTKKHEFIQGRT